MSKKTKLTHHEIALFRRFDGTISVQGEERDFHTFKDFVKAQLICSVPRLGKINYTKNGWVKSFESNYDLDDCLMQIFPPKPYK